MKDMSLVSRDGPAGVASGALLRLLGLLGAGLIGCAPPGAGAGLPPMPPPAVGVCTPVQREVIDASTFTGRTAAVESVRVRARVWGYLEKIHFRDGAEVTKDEVLFEIDARSYRAEFDRTDAALRQALAHRDRLNADFARAQRLVTQRAIGSEEFDKIAGDRTEAEANVKLAEAGKAAAQLNLEFSKVRAPISGRISRTMVTVGNLVQSGEMGGTTLTTIVSVDPVYAYFDVDDLTFTRINRLLQQEGAKPPVALGLAGETGYPHQGVVNFVDNQVDPSTGTIKLRGVFPNPDRLLTPGLFARIELPLGRPHPALLVTDRAVDTDQGQKVVFVVNDKNTVEKREVRLGRLHDGLREIESGIKPGERVIVEGIQRVRGGMVVDPKPVSEAKP